MATGKRDKMKENIKFLVWLGRDSFEKNDERMREFRRSQADVAMVNAQRLDEPTLLERMESLQVHRTMMETGGSRLPNGTTNWSALVPA